MRLTFRYRLHPNAAQTAALVALLSGAKMLYNAALEQRRTEWQSHRRSIRYLDQAAELKEARNTVPELTPLNFSACQDVLRRLDKAFIAFFRRLASGEKPGYPRFRGADRFDSITFPTYGDGIKLRLPKLYIQNVGTVRIKLHRDIQGTIKTVTVKRDSVGCWYACFSCDSVPPRPYPEASAKVGIDMGLTAFATLSTGEQVDNPRWYRQTTDALVKAQKDFSGKKPGTGSRKKAKLKVARLHDKAREQRRDFQHKLAHRIVSENAFIAVEDLRPNEMIAKSSTGLTKSILDAAWCSFLTILSSKAEEAGRTFVKVPPRGTSSTCSACGAFRQKTLSERMHRCDCGLVLDRDINASLNIIALGRSAVALNGTRSRLL